MAAGALQRPALKASHRSLVQSSHWTSVPLIQCAPGCLVPSEKKKMLALDFIGNDFPGRLGLRSTVSGTEAFLLNS